MDTKRIIISLLLIAVVVLFILHMSGKLKESFMPEMSPFPMEKVVIPGINAGEDKIGQMYQDSSMAVSGYSEDDSHAEVSF